MYYIDSTKRMASVLEKLCNWLLCQSILPTNRFNAESYRPKAMKTMMSGFIELLQWYLFHLSRRFHMKSTGINVRSLLMSKLKDQQPRSHSIISLNMNLGKWDKNKIRKSSTVCVSVMRKCWLTSEWYLNGTIQNWYMPIKLCLLVRKCTNNESWHNNNVSFFQSYLEFKIL